MRIRVRRLPSLRALTPRATAPLRPSLDRPRRQCRDLPEKVDAAEKAMLMLRPHNGFFRVKVAHRADIRTLLVARRP